MNDKPHGYGKSEVSGYIYEGRYENGKPHTDFFYKIKEAQFAMTKENLGVLVTNPSISPPKIQIRFKL